MIYLLFISDIESFYAMLTRLIFNGSLTAKAKDIRTLIAKVVEMNAIKHDPER